MSNPARRRGALQFTAVLLTSIALGASGCGADDNAATQISMHDLQFGPSVATATVGRRIEWRNDEQAPHNVIATSGADFHSQTIPQDGTFAFTARRSGTIKYLCSLHPGMTGTLRVSTG